MEFNDKTTIHHIDKKINISIPIRSLLHYGLITLIIGLSLGIGFTIGKRSVNASPTTLDTLGQSAYVQTNFIPRDIGQIASTHTDKGSNTVSSVNKTAQSWNLSDERLDNSSPKSIMYYPNNENTIIESKKDINSTTSTSLIAGDFFSSKTGKVYYSKNCKAGNRVKAENRVYYASKSDAEFEGLTLSKSCT